MTASSEHRPVRVRLFARYAELLGREWLELAPDRVRSVADVVEVVRSLPGGSSIPARPLVAVNLEQSDRERPIGPGDEVALLPPLAGG